MKTALVTGAGSGIGAATARTLSRAGYAVAVLARSTDEIETIAKHIRQAGGEAIAVTADVADEAQMRAAVDQVITTYGRLDVVVANAGVNGVWAPIDDLTADEWDQTIRINLRGTFLTLNLTIPHMKAEAAPSSSSPPSTAPARSQRPAPPPMPSPRRAAGAGTAACARAWPLPHPHQRRLPRRIETEIDDSTTIRHAERTEVPSIWPKGRSR